MLMEMHTTGALLIDCKRASRALAERRVLIQSN